MITEYVCEICRRRYSTAESAVECEKAGKFKGEEWVIGTMHEYHHNGYVGVFAIAKVTPDNGHLGYITKWACRAPGYPGDSLGEYMCGSDLVKEGEFDKYKKYRYLTEEKLNGPEGQRMVKFLRSEGIQPQYYNEQGELVKL